MSEVIDQGAAVEEGQNLRVAFSTADIREPFRLSLGSYGRPRVTEELKELGLNVGQPPAGGIHHTGKGSQYCSQGYKKLLRRHGFKVPPYHACKHALPGQWMSGTGTRYGNAAAWTFFKTKKAELLWQRSWPARRGAGLAIFDYINGFCNPRRRHSALGWKSQLAFEALAASMR